MYSLVDLSWEEIGNYLQHDDRVILALGAVEEHGRHLGIGTDFFEADAIAMATAEEAHVLAAPTLTYGQSMSLMGFSGTISLRPTTLVTVIQDLIRSLYQHGFRRILIVNGHGGNTASAACAIDEIMPDCPALRVKYFQWWTDPELCAIINAAMGEQKGSHATAGETAFMMSIQPQAVKLDRLTGKDFPVDRTRELQSVHNVPRKFPDGIMGLNPASATRETGDKILGKCVEICVRELKDWDNQ